MSIDKNLTVRVDEYAVEEIAPSVYKVNEYNLTTMFVVVGAERALLIDCGTGVGDYKAVAERLAGGKPYDLAVTHAHCDHIGGRGQFEHMYISEKDVPIIGDANTLFRKFYVGVMKYLMFFKVIRWRDAKIERVKKEPETHFIKEGDRFELGGKTVVVYETPGHTRGSLSFLLKEDRMLFTGDVSNPNNLMFLKWATSTEEMLASLKKIRDLEGYDVAWASHLSAPVSKETLENGIACAEKITSHKNGLPILCFSSLNDFTVINWAHKRRIRKSASR